MRVNTVRNWKSGLITNVEAYSIPDDAASDSLNWLTEGDKIVLRRGYSVVGTDLPGVGKVTGLAIGRKRDGTALPYYTHNRKLKCYDGSDWVEVGTDSLPADSDGQDVLFAQYNSLAGNQMFMGNPYLLWKIMIANPASITDVYNSAKNFKGYLKMGNARSVLWNTLTDKSNFNGSWIDGQDSTVYTTVNNENIGTGDGVLVTFTDTLVFKAGGSRRTCFGITATDGTENFIDNYDGTLSGSAGGTGTINYTTGAISVTFAVAPANLQAITATYQWEDSSVKGVVDYSKTAIRVAGEGFFVPQGNGGRLVSVLNYKDTWYCLHEYIAWFFNMPASDTSPTNRIFRDKIGIRNVAAAVATGDGIIYIDTSSPSAPYIRRLTYDVQGTEVVPTILTYNIKLDGYDFSDAFTQDWGDYIVFSCRSSSEETANNRMILYNKKWKCIDLVSYNGRFMEDNDGELWCGDSLSKNVQVLFSGFSDNGSTIANHWIGNISRLEIDQIKKTSRITIEGEIQPTQQVRVSISNDRGGFTELGIIDGTGSYVDAGTPVNVGTVTVGSRVVGGGDPVTAFHYRREFLVRSPRFFEAQLKFEALNVGYVSVSTRTFYDITTYGQQNILRYKTNTPVA